MRLTKEKLLAAWRTRKQIFTNSANENIIKRYMDISSLFDEIDKSTLSFDSQREIYIYNGIDILFKDGTKPSINYYFSCKIDEVTADQAFDGVAIMSSNLPKFSSIIERIGCMLGGFSIDNNHKMTDEYRIISNSVTGWADNGTLNSSGRVRHPSSHFADNNYFFNVIKTIKDINNDNLDLENTKLVLRWPNATYYSDDKSAEKSQKDALRYRFPYKYFYMWTHNVIHPVSLLAYRNLVQQEDELIQYKPDISMDQDFIEFSGENGWTSYSEAIMNMIPKDERGDDFWNEISKLLSVIMLQDQQIKNIRELLETNKAIILYGPPGTGKTYNAKKLVCDELEINTDELEKFKFDEHVPLKDKGTWTLVQFHPNYTYEDFIGGISPCLTAGSLSYSLKTGIFKKFCDTAVKDENKDKKFILIIDEINRADLSSVFGELMYALEYRNESISIPNFADKFIIPSNIYIIGTMNSIDKSLVTFDLALRRRFGFIKIMPQLSVLESILADYKIEETYLDAFVKRCKELNDHIARPNSRLQLGADYQIGHAYYGKIKDFLKKKNLNDSPQVITSFDLEKLWEYHLEPLLEEFLGNRIEDTEVIICIEERKNEFTKPLV